MKIINFSAFSIALFLSFSLVKAANSTYSGGDNHDLNGGAWGPYNLGTKAKYGMIQLRSNQEFTYDDNLYLTESNRTNDWASITSPGLMYRLGNFQKNAVEVGYDVNVVRFFEHDQEDGEEHLPYLRSQIDLGKTKLKLSNDMKFVGGGTNRGSNNEVTERIRKTSNDAMIKSETQIDDKLALGLHLHDYWLEPKGALLERNEIDGGAILYYKAFAKAELYLAGVGGYVDVSQGGRQVFGQYKVGFRGELSPFLVGFLDIGGEHRTSSIGGISDQDTPILGGSLVQKWMPDLNTRIKASRKINPSIGSPGQTITATSAGCTLDYQFGPILNKELKTRKLAATLDYSFENDEFDLAGANGIRQDTDINTLISSFEYRVQDYWKLYLCYRFQDLDTNVTGSDYDNHRISLGTSAFF